MIPVDVSSIISGGIGAALVSGLFIIAQVVVNKKLRTPADEAVQEQNAETRAQNAIQERNNLIAQYQAKASEAMAEARAAREEVKDLHQALEETDRRLAALREEFMTFRAEWINWGYRAVATIRQLGSDEDVPRPAPKGLQI